jgi:hypothetical protein
VGAVDNGAYLRAGGMGREASVKVGDIVSHSSGRICNGSYGEVVFALGELMVQDNEGALDMPVQGNENSLRLEGNIQKNPELLNEFVTLVPRGCVSVWWEESA